MASKLGVNYTDPNNPGYIDNTIFKPRSLGINYTDETQPGYTGTSVPLQLNLNTQSIQATLDKSKIPYQGPKGLNSAESEMVLNGVGGLIGITGAVIQGNAQAKENDKNRLLGRQIAEMNRSDELKQNKFVNSINTKVQEEEEKAFKFKKMKDINDLRFNRFITLLQKSIDAENNMQEVAGKFTDTMKYIKSQQSIINNYTQG